MVAKEFILITYERPQERNATKDMEWLGRCLGLVGPRDKEKTTLKVLWLIVQNTRGPGISATEISNDLGITKVAVAHHLHKLRDRGLLLQTKRKYTLRKPTIQQTIDAIERDIDEKLKQIQKFSEEMDKAFGLR
ncbi:MAG: ArsR family transcriptional regulator [Candidatus Diapherotrites archaeon]|nr:ArsR family transcriptional regulator [Candidatus Diapherotrites archaeon]